MSTEAEQNFVYLVVTGRGSGVHSKDLTSEEEAAALANALRDRDPERYRDVEVERRERTRRGYRAWLKRGGEWFSEHNVRAGWTIDQIREAERAEAEARAKLPKGPRTFVGTFSRQNFHPNTGQNLRHAYVELQASSNDNAQDLMWDAFGQDGWYDTYELHEVREQIRVSPYFRVAWPIPQAAPRETITLRVRITPEQAKQTELWIAGRCILHRPAFNCLVQYGAGVWPEDGEYPHAAWSNHNDPMIRGAGLVLHVKCFNRPDAERAVAADPENISIVP